MKWCDRLGVGPRQPLTRWFGLTFNTVRNRRILKSLIMTGVLLKKFQEVARDLPLRFSQAATGVAYDDTILTLTSASTPDPFVVRSGDNYYLTHTTGNSIEIWCSNNLFDLENPGNRHVIWTPPPDTDHSSELWAPELHYIHGRWYVYYAAADPSRGNKSHRMFVLGGPQGGDSDPCGGSSGGEWEFLGRVRGMPPDQWAIDGTVFELNDKLYFAYSGWPLGLDVDSIIDGDRRIGGGFADLMQELYITQLEDPITAVAGSDGGAVSSPHHPNQLHQQLQKQQHQQQPQLPAVISRPDREWEFTMGLHGRHGVNEGPQFLRSPDGGWMGLVYSCGGSWTAEYKMATLRYLGGDPLDPASWRKSAAPLVETRDPLGPWGPGHGSFLDLSSGDGESGGAGARNGGNVVAVFHATDNPTDGWVGRRARVQRVMFTPDGPFMGRQLKIPTNQPGLLSMMKQKILGRRNENRDYNNNNHDDDVGGVVGGGDHNKNGDGANDDYARDDREEKLRALLGAAQLNE